MFDDGVCFGGMLRTVALSERRGYGSGCASPKSNIPALHKLDTFNKNMKKNVTNPLEMCVILPASVRYQRSSSQFLLSELVSSGREEKPPRLALNFHIRPACVSTAPRGSASIRRFGGSGPNDERPEPRTVESMRPQEADLEIWRT